LLGFQPNRSGSGGDRPILRAAESEHRVEDDRQEDQADDKPAALAFDERNGLMWAA